MRGKSYNLTLFGNDRLSGEASASRAALLNGASLSLDMSQRMVFHVCCGLGERSLFNRTCKIEKDGNSM